MEKLLTRWEVKEILFKWPCWVTEWPANISVTLGCQALNTHPYLKTTQSVFFCSTNTRTHTRPHSELDTRGGMLSHGGGASNWIKPRTELCSTPRLQPHTHNPLFRFLDCPPRPCLKKVSLVADGKQMWTGPCTVKVQSQAPTSTLGQEYIFIGKERGVHLHLLQLIKSHSSVCKGE